MPLGSKWKARSYWSNYYEPLEPKRTGETTVHIGGGLANTSTIHVGNSALQSPLGLVLATGTALRITNATAGGAPGALPRQVAEKAHSLNSSAIRRLCSLQQLGFLPSLVKICCIVGEHLQVRPTFYGQYTAISTLEREAVVQFALPMTRYDLSVVRTNIVVECCRPWTLLSTLTLEACWMVCICSLVRFPWDWPISAIIRMDRLYQIWLVEGVCSERHLASLLVAKSYWISSWASLHQKLYTGAALIQRRLGNRAKAWNHCQGHVVIQHYQGSILREAW